MKSIVFFLTLFTMTSVNAATSAQIQTGDAFSCVDSVSGYTYELAVEDIGDEEAIMAVFGPKGALIAVHSNVHFEMFSDAAEFMVFESGQLVESIRFENFDLARAVYSDGGDSRPLRCSRR